MTAEPLSPPPRYNIFSAPLGAFLLTFLPMQRILAIDVATALFAIIPSDCG